MRVSRASDAAAPLRVRTLLWQLVVLLLAEVWRNRSCAARLAESHWETQGEVGPHRPQVEAQHGQQLEAHRGAR